MASYLDNYHYSFYPCGYTPLRNDTNMLWVRYKTAAERSSARPVVTATATETGAYIDAPDREIYVDRYAHVSDNDRPLRNWDECTSLSYLYQLGDDYPNDRFMINHTTMTAKEKRGNWRTEVLDPLQSNKTIICDCLTADTLLFTTDGVMQIAEYAAGSQGQSAYMHNIRVATPEGKSIKPVMRFKSKKRKVYQLTTYSGQQISCSANELFMTRSGWKKLQHLTDRDEVSVVFGSNVWSKSNVEFNYSKDTYLNRRFGHYPDYVTCPFCSEQFQQLDSHLTFKHNYQVSRFAEEYGQSTKSKAIAIQHSSKKMIEDFDIPSYMTAELATLLGIIVGDGRLRNTDGNASVSISCGLDKDVALLCQKLFKSIFNMKTELEIIDTSTWSEEKLQLRGVKPTPGSIYYLVKTYHSRMFMDFLDYLGLPATLSYDKQIPWSVLRSSREVICAFLGGLYTADGHVSQIGLQGLYSSSRMLIQQLSAVLLNLGIPTILRHNEYITLPVNRNNERKRVKRYGGVIAARGKDANARFSELISIPHKRKLKRQNCQSTNHHNGLESQGVIEYTITDKSSGIIWDQVVSIKELKKKQVTYDLTMPTKEHQFIAGGFWVHNSGGFQLSSGKEVWVDPEDLAEFYNANIDEGVTLDIPIRTYNRDLLVRMLAVQKANSKMLIEGLEPEVRLANVVHGFDYQDFTFIREHLWENERMDILCIPSSRVLPDIKSIDRLIYHMTHGMEYKQYHLLGIYNMTWLSLAIKFIYEWNKLKNKNILLTSDASSSIYSASALRYHKQPMPYRSVSRWPIGKMAPVSGDYNLTSKILPCQCGVCNVVKYQDVFNVLGDVHVAAMLTRHNEIETIHWTRLMCEAAATMDIKTYLAFCLSQNQSKDKRSIQDAFLYMENFFNEGADANAWKKTHAKYRHKINTLFNIKVDKEQLFDSSRDLMLENEDVSSLNKHLDVVLKRYERFHRTGKKPKVLEKNRKSFFALLGANSTGVEAKK